jgi:nitroimidazol reductase NimA-like FMN-containing flavoprotein (pyridoxamine 5'-phosphate oxidase superfamily)
MPAAMTRDEVHAFLDSGPGWIVLTTIGRDGYPHSVPIGYFRVGEEVYLGCRDRTQKVLNARRNPKVSLSLESGHTMSDIRGVLIQGEATVYTAPEDLLRLGREAARQRGVADDELPNEAAPGSAYIGVRPVKIISWDYAKEG